jgi:hypothetical protein
MKKVVKSLEVLEDGEAPLTQCFEIHKSSAFDNGIPPFCGHLFMHVHLASFVAKNL